MKRLWFGLVAVAALVVWAVPAFAQWGEETAGNNLRVRIGAFFPTESASRNKANTWFTAGVDYVLQREATIGEGYSANLGVSLDYYGSGDVYNMPVLLNYWGKVGSGFGYTAGIGIGFSKRLNGDTKTGLAYTIGLNYDLGTGQEGGTQLFIDARFNGLTGTDNEHNGFAVGLGVRF